METTTLNADDFFTPVITAAVHAITARRAVVRQHIAAPGTAGRHTPAAAASGEHEIPNMFTPFTQAGVSPPNRCAKNST